MSVYLIFQANSSRETGSKLNLRSRQIFIPRLFSQRCFAHRFTIARYSCRLDADSFIPDHDDISDITEFTGENRVSKCEVPNVFLPALGASSSLRCSTRTAHVYVHRLRYSYDESHDFSNRKTNRNLISVSMGRHNRRAMLA